MAKSYDELLENIRQLTEENEQLKKAYDKLGEMYDDLSLSYEDALMMYDQTKEKICMESELQVASKHYRLRQVGLYCLQRFEAVPENAS